MDIDVKKGSVLVFAPHHDDESIGMGGTIKILTNRGANVNLVVVTAGYSGVAGPLPSEQKIDMREKECLRAAKVLGVRRVKFLRMKDRAILFDECTLERFVETIRKFNPAYIYLPHGGESDRDHRMVNEIGKEAAWIAAVRSVFPQLGKPSRANRVIYYEVWSPMQKIGSCVDISSVLEAKKKAIECYKTQLKGRDYLKMTLGLNMFRGVKHLSSPVGEAFGS